MKKWISVLAAGLGMLGLMAQSADAATRRAATPERPQFYIGPFNVGDPYVFAAGVIVGVGTLGAYYAIENHRALKIQGDGRHFSTGAYALTTVGCMALTPMLASALVYANEGRMLSHREALGSASDCIVPFLGSLLWNAAYDANPQWPGQ